MIEKERFRKVVVERPLEDICNYLSTIVRGLRQENEMLKAENKALKDQALLIHERITITDRKISFGRL